MTNEHIELPRKSSKKQLFRALLHDPYREPKKLIEATFCVECKALFSRGRWQWTENYPTTLIESTCPACRRIKDDVPAGYLKLKGQFFAENRDEIMRFILSYSSAISERKPLSRIITMSAPEDGTVQIAFTDTILPISLGDAIRKSYQGELTSYFEESQKTTYVNWKR